MLAKPKKKPGIGKLKDKVWDEFSLFVRLRDALAYQELHPETVAPHAPCVTCGVIYPSLGVGCLQGGHFIPGRKAAYIFDERQVYSQCYNCNVRLKGNWPPYLSFMEDRYGADVVEKMRNEQRHEIVKFTVPELEEKLAYYKSRVIELKTALDISI